jgi:hypothetical protein
MLSRALTVLIAVVALTACGSSTTPTTDEERVDAALLRITDFPADDGWAVEPTATDDPAQAQLDEDLDQCEQDHDPTVDVRTADRDSDDFARDDVAVGSNASVVTDSAIRDELFDALDILMSCAGEALEAWLRGELGEDARITVTDPYELDVTTAADRTAGRAIQLGIDPASFFLDVIVVEEGPTLLYVLFLHQGELDLADEEEIVGPAVQRLEDL